MAYKKSVCKLFLLTVSVLFMNGGTCKGETSNTDGFYYQLPMISYDFLGNCYVQGFNHKGRCIRYQECRSALNAWQNYRKFPFICNNNGYYDFVCCSEAFVAAIPYHTSIYYHNKSTNPISSHVGTKEKPRTSEKQCALIYNNSSNHYSTSYSHRSKRNSNTIDFDLGVVDYLRPVVKEIPSKKFQILKTEIVGGMKTYRNEFPYMCALGWRKGYSKHDLSFICGCVLIASKYVLTVAHCASLGGEPPLIVRLGDADLDERFAEMINIESIIQHPDYNARSNYNDIAIIKLKKESETSPACLWPDKSVPQQTSLVAIGYGQTAFGGPVSKTLLKVYLNVLTNQICDLYYPREENLKYGISSGQICAEDPQGKMDTCQGDSGSPLIRKESKYNTQVPYVVGLTSFGTGCGSNTPGVYTRISYYIDWVELIVWK